MIGTLTSASFEPYLNTAFTISGLGQSDTLTLVEVSAQPVPGAPREPFSLIFHGARTDIMFTSHIQSISHPEMGEMDLFISPVGKNEDGTWQYQIVFN